MHESQHSNVQEYKIEIFVQKRVGHDKNGLDELSNLRGTYVLIHLNRYWMRVSQDKNMHKSFCKTHSDYMLLL